MKNFALGAVLGALAQGVSFAASAGNITVMKAFDSMLEKKEMFNENKLVDLSEFANEFQLKQLKAELIKLTNGKKSDILLFVNNNDKLILPKILAHLEIYEMSKNPKLFALKYPEIFIKLELDLDKAIFFLGAWITENEKQKQTDV